MMEDVLVKYIENSDEFAGLVIGQISSFMISGIATIAILWAAVYSIKRVYDWFHEWTSR